jgi:Uma2 family endonuclease
MDARFTAEEASRLSLPGLWELVDGRVVPMSPAGARHALVVARVTRALAAHVETLRLGAVLAGDAGFILRRNPDTVRGPDVAFVTAARLPGRPPAEFLEGAPDLAVEVVSPSDSWRAVDAKAREFVSAGALAVWAIDPGAETAKIYTRDGARVLARGEVLTCPELLGGFELRLLDLWQ